MASEMVCWLGGSVNGWSEGVMCVGRTGEEAGSNSPQEKQHVHQEL